MEDTKEKSVEFYENLRFVTSSFVITIPKKIAKDILVDKWDVRYEGKNKTLLKIKIILEEEE